MEDALSDLAGTKTGECRYMYRERGRSLWKGNERRKERGNGRGGNDTSEGES